jgi:hypothetical protein
VSKKARKARSVNQRVGNEANKRKLARDDGFVAYVMDRLLCRVGRSSQADEFYLKGGVLVANLVDEPHRFTRDVDFLRRHGPPDPEDIRDRFDKILAVALDDGITFGRVRAIGTDRAVDDYGGVKVFVAATVEGQEVQIRVDIGFGDAVEPETERVSLVPFLEEDPPASVRAYQADSVVAEKVQTVVARFPVIAHRLKDVLDVVILSERLEFDGTVLVRSFQATFARRETRPDVAVLDDMLERLRGRAWETDWSMMVRDKAVAKATSLADAVAKFDAFVRPLILALAEEGPSPLRWPPGGPWSSRT